MSGLFAFFEGVGSTFADHFNSDVAREAYQATKPKTSFDGETVPFILCLAVFAQVSQATVCYVILTLCY